MRKVEQDGRSSPNKVRIGRRKVAELGIIMYRQQNNDGWHDNNKFR